MKRNDYEKKIFGNFFKTSNSLQLYLDHLLSSDGLTAKQMFLMIVIDTFGEKGPTLKEAAEKSGTSYQNVKQLALKLEQNGFLCIRTDETDKRRKLLLLSEKAKNYWLRRELADRQEMSGLFKGLSIEELNLFLKFIKKLHFNLTGIQEVSK